MFWGRGEVHKKKNPRSDGREKSPSRILGFDPVTSRDISTLAINSTLGCMPTCPRNSKNKLVTSKGGPVSVPLNAKLTPKSYATLAAIGSYPKVKAWSRQTGGS
jgi:hypothetical protein